MGVLNKRALVTGCRAQPILFLELSFCGGDGLDLIVDQLLLSPEVCGIVCVILIRNFNHFNTIHQDYRIPTIKYDFE